MSLTKDQANSQSTVSHDALVAADNARFIADVDKQILEAIALGLFQVNANTFGNVCAKDVFQYYADLGYFVIFPDLQDPPQSLQPASLFGYYWEAFWSGKLFVKPYPNPVRMIVGWKP